MRLAVFTGQYFWFDGKHYSTDEAFIKFVTSFYPHFEKILFCDAVKEERKTQAYVLNHAKAEVCPLPNFTVYSFWRNILIIFPKIYRIIRNNIDNWDVIWLPAPHVVSLIFVYICKKENKPFFLFIRQNLRSYVAFRNCGSRKLLAVSVAVILEYVFRRLARYTLTFTVGKEMFYAYRRTGKRVYETSVSLVSHRDIADTRRMQVRDNGGRTRLINVGRLGPEKGIIYLIRAMDELVSNGKRDIILKLVGNGSEENSLRREVDQRGLSEYVDFLGYMSHGPQLLSLLRTSDIFVLPSLTEGWPQSLFEAMACGVAIVATRVGGIPYLIEDGKNGLLVEPGSPSSIREAVERLISDSKLRRRLTVNGLSTVRSHTIKAERDRMMCRIREFLEATQH